LLTTSDVLKCKHGFSLSYIARRLFLYSEAELRQSRRHSGK
jgi:hypothetical protein